MPNRRRRRLSTATSAVVALAVASPVAVVALSDLSASTKPAPQHREFVQAAMITDLPNELLSALSQGLSQFGINLPTSLLTGPGSTTPPVVTTPGLTTPGLTAPGLTAPGASLSPLTATGPALTDPALANPALTNPALTSPIGTPPLGAVPPAPDLTTPGLTTPPASIDPALTPISTTGLPNEVPMGVVGSRGRHLSHPRRPVAGDDAGQHGKRRIDRRPVQHGQRAGRRPGDRLAQGNGDAGDHVGRQASGRTGCRTRRPGCRSRRVDRACRRNHGAGSLTVAGPAVISPVT